MAVMRPCSSVLARVTKAFCLALASTGSNKPARMAMMAMTTSNSMRVNPTGRRNDGTWDFFIEGFWQNDGRRTVKSGERTGALQSARMFTRGDHAYSDQ